jgi:hypothetical protein
MASFPIRPAVSRLRNLPNPRPIRRKSPANSANIPVFRRHRPEARFDRHCMPTAAFHFADSIRGADGRGAVMNKIMFPVQAERSLGQEEKFSHVWDLATHIDQTLVEWCRYKAALTHKYVEPQAFSRRALFTSLVCDQPIVVSNLRISIEGSETDRQKILLEAIKSKIDHADRIKVRAGQAETSTYLSSSDLVARWQRGRAKLCVTDFHFRETPLEHSVDLRPLSEFNLLAHASGSIADEEMMTLVMSSQGAFTDSHSDDLDVSNHCVTGRKLWLVWDTQEGRKAGLEDVERDIVYDRAAFDLATFCKLDSARWLTVGPEETLFLPGRFTHRVITVERYLGFGSFFVSLPNLLQTANRWTTLPPLWLFQKGNDHLADAILAFAVDRLKNLLTASSATKHAWGLQYLPLGVRRWLGMTSIADRRRVQERPSVRELVRLAKQIDAWFGEAE